MNIVANLINSDHKIFEKEERTDLSDPKVQRVKKRTPKDIESFDSRMSNIIMYLKGIHQLKNQNEAFNLSYLVELFDTEITEYDKSRLLTKINAIGFEILKNTFERINMECKDYFCESEDLFGIFKRHQFNKKLPVTDSDKLRQVIQYIHITLIHINILHRRGISSPVNLICSKKDEIKVIESFIKAVEAILLSMLNQYRING
jgi:hypothetical protein